jgi:hypothetical protein
MIELIKHVDWCLDSLALHRSRPKRSDFEGWKSLDFLGFSRPDSVFSMGYDGFSLIETSCALPGGGRAETGARGLFDAGGRADHGGELTPPSDF